MDDPRKRAGNNSAFFGFKNLPATVITATCTGVVGLDVFSTARALAGLRGVEVIVGAAQALHGFRMFSLR
jgi:hypothetical protein